MRPHFVVTQAAIQSTEPIPRMDSRLRGNDGLEGAGLTHSMMH